MSASRALKRGWVLRFAVLFTVVSAVIAPLLTYYEQTQAEIVAGNEGIHLRTAEQIVHSAFQERQRDTRVLAKLPSTEHFLTSERQYWRTRSRAPSKITAAPTPITTRSA